MKKFFTLLLALCLTALVFAQSAADVIITNDSRKIDAKIMEVSKTEIKYKEITNLDGPMFILSTDEIRNIIYSNGTVQVYDNAPQKEAQKAESAENNVTILTRDGQSVRGQLVRISDESLTYKSNGVEYTLFAAQLDKVAMPDGQIKSYNTSSAVYTGNNPNLKPLNLYQSYLELGGHFGVANGFASGGAQLLDINGIRFNKCFFLGFGTGFLFNYGYVYDDDWASYDLAIPLFADLRAYTPTGKEGLYPFCEVGVGPLLHFYTFEACDNDHYPYFHALAYFRVGAGVEYKRFVFSAGYELWANAYARIHMGSIRFGVRLGKNPY